MWGPDYTYDANAYRRKRFVTARFPIDIDLLRAQGSIQGAQTDVYDLGCLFIGAKTISIHLELEVEDVEQGNVRCGIANTRPIFSRDRLQGEPAGIPDL